MKKKRLPIGSSDFKQLIDEDLYYVDKTMLIDELLRTEGRVVLIPRPRRFGKTLNMSMLRYFFEKTKQSQAYLFTDKKIWQIPERRALQGSFPVITITFKDIKESTWEVTQDKIIGQIAEECNRHDYLLQSGVLRESEKNIYTNVCSKTASTAEYHDSLKKLSEYLYRYYQVKPIVLIDEYDTPVHAGFIEGYYTEVVGFVRGLLCGVFKDNEHIEKGIITGILRTAKEGIFSGLNNLVVWSLFDNEASDKYGFTQDEVDTLLRTYELEAKQSEVQSWYNGYHFGQTASVYNPWSLLEFVRKQGVFDCYWVNTSSNDLICKIIASSTPEIKTQCAELIDGKPLHNIEIEDKMVLPSMANDANAIWSLFLFSGYVTLLTHQFEMGIRYADLKLPNNELTFLFKKLASDLFRQGLDNTEISYLEQSFKTADASLFSKMLSKFIIQSMSYYDIPENEPEKSYHLFVLGLLVTLSRSYLVRSNRESGYGRFDIILIPRDRLAPGIIIEFKKLDNEETMEETCDRALEQIRAKKYAVEVFNQGIPRVFAFGVACHKKDVLVKREELQKE